MLHAIRHIICYAYYTMVIQAILLVLLYFKPSTFLGAVRIQNLSYIFPRFTTKPITTKSKINHIKQQMKYEILVSSNNKYVAIS